MGIPPGARLVHPGAPELEVRVAGDYRLIWRGEDHSLTSLTKTLTREMGLPTSRDLWEFEGRSLGVIYGEAYGIPYLAHSQLYPRLQSPRCRAPRRSAVSSGGKPFGSSVSRRGSARLRGCSGRPKSA